MNLGLGIAVDRYNDLPPGVRFDPGLGFSLGIGYRFHPNLAVEGSVDFFEGIHSDDTTPSSEGDILTFAGSIKGYLSTRRLQPYVLVGLGVTRARIDEGPARYNRAGVSVLLGGGMDYYLLPGISLGIKVTYFEATGKIHDNDHIGIALGVQYRF